MKRSPLLALALVVFVDMLGFSIIIPVMPYYGEAFGATPTLVGLLFASYSFMQFIFAPLWGSLSDRIGRRPVILVGLAGAALGFLVFGLAQNLGALFASRILAGAMAATIPVAMAAVADLTTAENRAKSMGLLGAAIGLGFVIGPAVGGMIEHLGHGAPAYTAAILAVINFAWVAVALPESLNPATRGRSWLPIDALRHSLESPAIIMTFIVLFASYFAFAAMEGVFGLLVEYLFNPGLDRVHLARRVGMYLGFVGIIIVIVQGGLLGRLVKSFGEGVLIPAGLAFMAIGLVVLPYSRTTGALLVVLAVLSIGSAMVRPIATSVLSQIAPEETRGGVLSVNQSLSSLAHALGPAWGGWMYHHYGYTSPFVIGGIVTGIAFAGAIALLAMLPPAVRGRRTLVRGE